MSTIKSYEEKLSDVEKMLDSMKKEAFPRTESYTKTVGFGQETNELKPGSYTSPVSIPAQRKTSTAPIPSNSPLDKGYKSQLQGWSTDGKEASILSSSPRSFEASKISVISPKSAPTTPATTTTTTSTTSHIGKQPELKLDPKLAKNMTKEERRAQYEAMAAQKKQGKTSEAAPKKTEKPAAAATTTSTMTKEERKAQYEAQAQKKQEQRKTEVTSTTPPSGSTAPPPRKLSQDAPKDKEPAKEQPKRTAMQFDDVKKRKAAEKKKIVLLQPSSKQVSLFSHLPQYERNAGLKFNIGFTSKDIHPEFLSLGLKYAQGTIMGSTARCVALLTAFRKVIAEFVSPNGDLFRDFDLKPLVQFIVDCRPMSVSMGNAINYIKICLSATKTMNETEAKAYMDESIERFINERIIVAGELIAKHGNSKIHDGDVILTYARSHVVEMTLVQAHKEGKKFRVVVVDSHPKKEGKELLRRLSKLGIKCTYVLITAVSYIMSEVTKVFVGAYTMMANGNLMSRVGTALIATMAQSYHVPFIVCCETCKFSERVQLESISFNELGDPDELVNVESEEQSALLKDWKDIPNLKLLNLMYDLTPSEFIVMVVTEVGLVPPSSVPVILREYRKEPQEY